MPRGLAAHKNTPPSGNEAGRAAFARAMRRLAEVEALPVYAAMCTAADAAITGVGRVAEHGWGDYGSTGDPRKRRKAVAS